MTDGQTDGFAVAYTELAKLALRSAATKNYVGLVTLLRFNRKRLIAKLLAVFRGACSAAFLSVLPLSKNEKPATAVVLPA